MEIKDSCIHVLLLTGCYKLHGMELLLKYLVQSTVWDFYLDITLYIVKLTTNRQWGDIPNL